MDRSRIEKMYEAKNPGYYNQIRFDAIDVILTEISLPVDAKVLDVGCGSCETLTFLKENGYCGVIDGVEISVIEKSNQQNPLIENLYIGEIENVLDSLKRDYYDLVLCLDVLEHLVDPWRVVIDLSSKINKDGYLLVSCPNIREIRTIYQIFVKGSFKYSEAGILDRTHLRFFTAGDLRTLECENLDFLKLIPNYKLAPNRRKIKKLHFGILDTVLAPQYFALFKRI